MATQTTETKQKKVSAPKRKNLKVFVPTWQRVQKIINDGEQADPPVTITQNDVVLMGLDAIETLRTLKAKPPDDKTKKLVYDDREVHDALQELRADPVQYKLSREQIMARLENHRSKTVAQGKVVQDRVGLPQSRQRVGSQKLG